MKRPGRLRRSRLRRRPRRQTQPPGWRLDLGPCAVCPAEGEECAGPVQGHHVISKQTLKRLGLGDQLWNRRNRLAVCERRHQQHERATRRIPRSLIPQDALDFADEHGLTRLIERYYPGNDPRS